MSGCRTIGLPRQPAAIENRAALAPIDIAATGRFRTAICPMSLTAPGRTKPAARLLVIRLRLLIRSG